MSQYIVDASVVVQFLITDTHTQAARALFRSLTVNDRLYMPEFCLLECANVLWKQVRFSDVPQSDAEQLVSDLLALDVVVVPVIGLLPRALQIGVKHQLTIYDSVYIALVEKLGCPLITDDAKQAASAAAEGIVLTPITDFST
jgi:predicted nucleic acid-binding protein